MNAPVSRLLFAPRIEPDGSLLGAVSASISDNLLPSLGTVLVAAGYSHHRCWDLALRNREHLPRLAEMLHIPEAELARLDHPPIGSDGLFVSFFGAAVPHYDLDLRSRRIAPAALKRSHHHRALWTHRLLLADPETCQLLIDRCPACRLRLGWNSMRSMARCDRCDADLLDAEAPYVDPAQRDGFRFMTGLLHPVPETRTLALSALPDDIAGLDRGEVFEMGWRLAGLFAPVDAVRSRHARRLHQGDVLERLALGAALLRGWPGALRDALSDLVVRDGEEELRRVHRAMRLAAGALTRRPAMSTLLRTSFKDVFRSYVTAAGRLGGRSLIGKDAARIARLNHHRFVKARRAGAIGTLIASGTKSIHATYLVADMEAVGQANRSRTSSRHVADQLGISVHGVEQLAALGVLEPIDNATIRACYLGVQVTAASFDALRARLIERATAFDDGEDLLPLSRAMRAIGGREKPWGPVLAALADGAIPFALGAPRGPHPQFAFDIMVRWRDMPGIVAMEFHVGDFPDAMFEPDVSTRDALETLNSTSRHHGSLKAVLGVGDKRPRLPREQIIELARVRISPGEVGMRWTNGSRKRQGTLWSLPRLDVLGWCRADVEELFRTSKVRAATGPKKQKRPRP